MLLLLLRLLLLLHLLLHVVVDVIFYLPSARRRVYARAYAV
jgi:hypothetical protein